MSRYNLRDVSERLTKSRTIETGISEFLRTLQGIRPDWRASLAFYEGSRDSLVDVYELDQQRLVRRNIVVPVDRLPHRLVRKIFQTTAFLNESDRTALFSSRDSTACYLADPHDASELMPLTVLAEWQSCICMPLGYQDDLIAMLVLVSAKKNAFGGKAIAEIVPVKSVATVSLAQHLYRSTRNRQAPEESEAAERLRKEMELLAEHSAKLGEENRSRAVEIETLMGQIELLDRNSSTYKEELEAVKNSVRSMEQDSEVATEYLTEAFSQLQGAQWTLDELERTIAMMKDAFQLLAESQDPEMLPETIVEWFSDRFDVERCSMLVPNPSGDTLQIAAQRGIDQGIVASIRVRVGQGVAGWVAAHRKPLYVRVREDARSLQRSPDGTYNSDSFVVVPLAHGGHLQAVLNLSNRADGEGFSQSDLDRAMLAASAFAVTLGSHQTARRAAVWV